MVSEKQFQESVRQVATKTGWLYYHTFDSRKCPAGFPDCVLVRGQRVIFAELKAQDGTVSLEQKLWLEALAKIHGNEVYIWRPDDFAEICELLK